MEDEEQAEGQGTRSRGRYLVVAMLILLSVGIIALWSARKPIARDYVDRVFARNGVPARYNITQFGLRRQRIENIVIGDPAAPDLTAEWVELGFGVSGISPSLRMVRAKGVRLRGRLVDGKLTLGAVDRLLPASSGKPFELPSLHLQLVDARMRLETPAGAIGLSLLGKGELTGGFIGRLAAVAHRLELSGCAVEHATAVLHISVADREPSADGPVRADRLACGVNSVERFRSAIDISASSGLDRLRGGAAIATAALTAGNTRAASMKGRLTFSGDAKDADARTNMTFEALRHKGIDINPAALDGTPLAPLANALRRALGGAMKRIEVDASLHLASAGGYRTLHVAPLSIQSDSGARLTMEASGERGIGWRWPDGILIADGKISLSGGGFPEAVLRVRQTERGLAGKLSMRPYQAGAARIAIDPLSFDPGGFSTRIRLDGPLAAGHVEGLDLQVRGQRASGAMRINPTCAPLSFTRLDIAGTRIGPARLALCPLDGALFRRAADGRIGGGAIIAMPSLRGRIGAEPLLLSARRLTASVGRPGFAIDRLAVRLGAGIDPTRLDVERLAGAIDPLGLSGTLSGAAGKIGRVPLLVSNGAGGWSLRNATLRIDGALDLDDASPDPRFHRLAGKDVQLVLKNGVITGSAALLHPGSGRTVTRVALAHDLGKGIGSARLAVPGIAFTKELQPEMLTRLTLGVIANARGSVAGNGRIDWNGAGVRSTGDFATEAMDFAAAFGPVTGLAGKIHFSDLLAMATPPGQTVTLASVNPGVAVENGVIRYQLLPDQQVRIEDGRWPFAGGELLLDPSRLDFGKPSDRYLTFRVKGMDAAQFVQQFEFKNIAVTGVFDGIMPMIFDAQGGRIRGGRLVVRQSGGTLAYVGELSNEQLGRFGNMAFDALKSIRYSNLAIELNGSLDGEIVSKVIFTGTNEAPVAARKGLMAGLTGLPFKFNITITAPFRSLVNSAQSINDPRGLVKGALEQLRAGQAAPASVQPNESEKMP